MHFIRAFPIVLIIVLVFGSCLAFADSSWYQGSQPLLVRDHTYIYRTNTSYYYSPNSDIPVYIFGYSLNQESLNGIVLISVYPTSVLYYSNNTESVIELNSTITVDGTKYYYSTSSSSLLDVYSIPIIFSGSRSEAIRYAFTSSNVANNNILFNITRFILASNTWLTSIVGTVMANPLLIFILLFYFVGTAIGLLFRLRRN